MAEETALLLKAPPTPAVLAAGRAARGLAIAAEFTLAAVGAAVILLAIAADQSWFDRHSLPHMFLSPGQELLIWQVERAAAILAGLVLVGPLRHLAGRRFAEGRGGEFAIQCLLVAIALPASLVVSELVLGTASWRGIDRWAASEEPVRRPDPYLGWTNLPARTGWEQFGGSRILYHIDAGGHRVGDPARAVDPRRPSIILTGESIMLGFRLGWAQSIAGWIEAASGLQAANLAVNGYGTDQAYMRLAAELPHFARPVAVVALFAPGLLERNLEDDRPHLDAALRWHPARPAWRVERVLSNLAIYHRRSAIDAGIAQTSAVLAATVRQAHTRGAAALILVPEFAPEQPSEAMIRRRVLDEAGLPYVRVTLDPRWRIPGDGHPDVTADRAMAVAVLAALHRQRPELFSMAPAAR